MPFSFRKNDVRASCHLLLPLLVILLHFNQFQSEFAELQTVSNKFASTGSMSCGNLQCDNGDCVVNRTSMTIGCKCFNGWTGPQCQFCDGRFRMSASEGTIHDGAGNYSLNTKCTWIIDTNTSKPLKLSFHHFSTECGWDHLHVFDGSSIYSPLVASFSGISDIVEDVILPSGRGFLYFYSDVAYSMGGFNITYRAVSCTLNCSGNGKCDRGTERCVCEVGWSGEACNISASCPSRCSGAAVCLNGTCQCPQNTTGDGCSLPTSPVNITWVKLDSGSSVPQGRASFGADVLGDYLYVYGGETLLNRFVVHSNTTVGFYRFDIQTGSWENLRNNFSSFYRFGHTLSADIVGRKLYLFGGTVDGLATGDLASYDVSSDNWQRLTPNLVPVAGHSAHVINNKLYVFLGQSSVYSFYQQVQLYDILTSNWSYVETSGVVFRGRYGHSSVYDDHTNTVLIFGGYHDSDKAGDSTISTSLYRFDISTSIWVGLMPAPLPSFLHSAVMLPEGLMLISGGNSHNDTASSSGSQCYSSRLLIYDMCCDKWVDLTETGVSRFGHTMFTHNGSTYVYGGFNGRMLADLLQLHTPDCFVFEDRISCEKGPYRRDPAFGTCVWNDTDGCTVRPFNAATPCDKLSCAPATPAEGLLRCGQFSDCISCHFTDGCLYKPETSCVAVSTTFTNNNAPWCPISSACSIYRGCEICQSIDYCVWSSASGDGDCLLKTEAGTVLEEDQTCPVSCSSHNTCSNCTTASGCLWCESQSQCIDSDSYLAYYPYGQCLEWTTNQDQCAEVACSEIQSCSGCQRNPMCGWCNHPSNTGRGECMRGGLIEDLRSTCSADSWHFVSCPACQCSGHSQCDSMGRCINCSGDTTGDHCESCSPGFHGDPINSGICQRCDCDEVADTCHSKTGACLCRVQGATGDRCNQCDTQRQYYKDTFLSQECYYQLGVDFRYTFNFSKPDDRHVTVINMRCSPKYDDREMELILTCGGHASINLTSYSTTYPEKVKSIYTYILCSSEEMTLKIDPEDYVLDSAYNSTIYLRLSEFHTPFVFQVSFSQYTRVDLFKFFLIFFGCFLFMLIVAGVVWKVKAHYSTMRRRSQERQERRNMASRPFASLIFSVDDLKSVSCLEKAMAARAGTKSTLIKQLGSAGGGGGESQSAFQRSFSKRNKIKLYNQSNMATAIGLEPLEGQKSTAVATVIVKLPTGGEDVPGYGCNSLAFGSTLVSISSSGTSQYPMSKVIYRHGKVTFSRSPAIFNS